MEKKLIKCSSVTFYQAAKCGKRSENTIHANTANHRDTTLLWCPEDQVFIADNKDWENPTIVGIVNVRSFIVDREQVLAYYKGKKTFDDDAEKERESIIKKLDTYDVQYNKKFGTVKLRDILKSLEDADAAAKKKVAAKKKTKKKAK